MTDPAIEAAWSATKSAPTPWTQSDVEDIAIAAAREALAPLRELHQRNRTRDRTALRYCVGCLRDWPCDTARLIYPSEEL